MASSHGCIYLRMTDTVLHVTYLFKPIMQFEIYNSTIRQEEFLKIIYYLINYYLFII